MKFDKDEILIVDDSNDSADIIRDIVKSKTREDVFYIFNVEDLIEKFDNWRKQLPRVTPYYAVKCNNHPSVLKILTSLGTGFDCASKEEIRQILSLGVHPSRIIFANPTKPVSHITYASDHAINMITFDNEMELRKMKTSYPTASLILRIRNDASTAKLSLGIKYGCDADTEAPTLLHLARDLNLNLIGICFHVGTGCAELAAYRRGIASAQRLFNIGKTLGLNMTLLDIGGGFPGERNQLFDKMTHVINEALDEFFTDKIEVNIIAEPGRYFVQSAFTLATTIHSKREIKDPKSGIQISNMYYINDGVYGSFYSLQTKYEFPIPVPLSKNHSSEILPCSIWGPTCDSLDLVVNNIKLPILNVGDWIIFENKGAYSFVNASRFNGFPPPKIYTVLNKSTNSILSLEDTLSKFDYEIYTATKQNYYNTPNRKNYVSNNSQNTTELTTSRINGTAKQIIYSFITFLIYLSYGITRNYESFLYYQLDEPDSNIRLNNDQKTWIAFCTGMLSPVTGIGSGIIMDKYGRKPIILSMFVPFVISWTIVSVSTTYTMLIIAMTVESTAIGIGINIVAYVSEISAVKYRGFILAILDSTMNMGVIMCSVLMYFFKWNIVSTIFAILSVACLLLTLVLPESPVWLYSRGQKDKAIDMLCALRSQSRDQLQHEIQDMENSAQINDHKENFYSSLRNCIKAWRQFSIAASLFLLLIFAGPLVLLSYTVMVIEALQLPYEGTQIAVYYSAAGFCGSFVTPFFMHNFKRRFVLAVSSGIMALSMLTIAFYELYFFQSPDKPYVWIVPCSLYIYNFWCNMGFSPIAMTIGGELFPLEVRGTLAGLNGTFINFSWSLCVKCYPYVMFDSGIRTMIWCFTAASFITVLFAVFVLPETKDKTLNEVQEQYFSKKKRPKKNSIRNATNSL